MPLERHRPPASSIIRVPPTDHRQQHLHYLDLSWIGLRVARNLEKGAAEESVLPSPQQTTLASWKVIVDVLARKLRLFFMVSLQNTTIQPRETLMGEVKVRYWRRGALWVGI
ncbi:hypothetical protein E2C01_058385 [Portunus trituberculatus]|uniref:Uncharacterized protein n=1 Tax=Portunus trituberculatus TaxID=210409 RepID=A0A5B7H2I2_PORTR|nr:hypothetical protein [Portunus trituberculatus]